MTDPAAGLRPRSRADRPDLDWSQVRETVLMLQVAVAQIGCAQRDGDESVQSLADAFADMMAGVQSIQQHAAELPEQSGQREGIEAACEAVGARMQSAVVAFQFYDKLSQRLAHLTDSLAELAGVVESPERLYNPAAWQALQDDIRSRYTLESDKIMFEAILAGASVAEALQQMMATCPGTEESDIDLF